LTAICWRLQIASEQTATSIGAAGCVVVVALEQMDLVGADRRLEQRLGVGVDRAAVDVDPALAAEEQDTVPVVGDLQRMLLGRAVVHVDQGHAVGVAVFDLPTRGGVGQHVFGE
jgi:hypothetical protein